MILIRRRAGGALPGPAPSQAALRREHDSTLGDRVLEGLAAAGGIIPAGILIFVIVVMVASALPAIRFGGTGFFGDIFSIGNPYLNPISQNGVSALHGARFGILPEALGTLVTSVIAIGIAVPVSVGGVLMLSEWVPHRAQGVLSLILELLAGVPSVVFGLWGVYTIGPIMAVHVFPALGTIIGGFPWLFPWLPSPASWILFAGALALMTAVSRGVRGPSRRTLVAVSALVAAVTLVGAVGPWFVGPVGQGGEGVLTASLVLAIMIIPIVASTTRELVRRVPVLAREGAMALGMNRHETATIVTIPYVRTGVLAVALLGWGRAIGETIAVFLIIGNIFVGFPANIFASGGTLSSTIVATLDGTFTDTTHTSTSALAEIGLMLLVISLITNFGGRAMIRRLSDEALPVGRGV